MNELMIFSAFFVASHVIGHIVFFIHKPNDIPFILEFRYNWRPYSFLSLITFTIYYFVNMKNKMVIKRGIC